MAFYGVGLDVAVKKLNFEFRMALKKKGGIGIRSLAIIFKQFDENGNKKLDAVEFEKALANAGLFPKKVEIQALMTYYDLDGDGNITYTEFLRGLREQMSERRSKIVDKAFSIIDRTNAGKVTAQDVVNIFNVSKHKDFISGKKKKEELIAEFLNNFEGPKGNKDGIITKEEFVDYYTDISMTIPNDDYFIGIIESAWMISENEGNAEYLAQLDHLETTVREKLRNVTQPLDETMLLKVFKELNKSKSGSMTIDELQTTLSKLECSAERNILTGLFKKFDLNKSGTIEFDEFCAFILNKKQTF